ncbi:heme o synthase [Paenibacillus koleovorans]|uniref:heme o synthase n=1 Tax=Paenibacillus koleovorans TaxID=121608 RepID=UPI000FD96184|nr:heme o synthase [Paenibacillus koleovorans]
MDKPLQMEGSLSVDEQAALEVQELLAVPRKATIRDYVNLAKPGILFSNLIAAFGGYWVGWGSSGETFSYLTLLFTMVGTALVMASGCVLNNYLDRDMDTKMSRTQKRALPTGVVTPNQVLIYGIVLGVIGLTMLFFFANPLAALLGVVGLLVYVWIYTAWLKRTSTFSTSVGAISGAMPPVIGYCAVTQELDAGAWILFGILFLWQPPHFWALGMRRKEEYRAAGYPLLPVVYGDHITKIHMIRYLVMLVPVSLMLYLYGYVGEIYLLTATVLGLIWVFLGFMGFKTKDDDTWAKRMFVYSINYLPILFIVMILDTVRV